MRVALQGVINNARVKLAYNCCYKGNQRDSYLLLGVHSVPTGRSTFRGGGALSWHQFVFGNTCFAQRWEETGEGRDGAGCLYLRTCRHGFGVFFSFVLILTWRKWYQKTQKLHFSVWMRFIDRAGTLPDSHPYQPYRYKGTGAVVHPWEGLAALCSKPVISWSLSLW